MVGTTKGLTALQTCIRLDPRDPYLAVRLLHTACGLYLCREYEASIEASKRLIRSYPDFPMIYRWPAAALGQLGRTAEAKEAGEGRLARTGGIRYVCPQESSVVSAGRPRPSGQGFAQGRLEGLRLR